MNHEPRFLGITASADWENTAPAHGKRNPYPGELDFLQAEARRLNPMRRREKKDQHARRVSDAFHALMRGRKIFVDGAP